jgi:hypothetical protein
MMMKKYADGGMSKKDDMMMKKEKSMPKAKKMADGGMAMKGMNCGHRSPQDYGKKK